MTDPQGRGLMRVLRQRCRVLGLPLAPTFVHAGILVAAGVFLLAGCARRTSEVSKSASAADTLVNGLSRPLLPKLNAWTQVWRHAIPSFSADSLRRNGSATFAFGNAWAGAGRAATGVRAKALVDVLSPDSARSLDFDMYLDLDRDGREPDSAPVLADFKSDTLWQVSFCGPSCFYDGAYWVDADRFALTGATQSGEQVDGPWCAFLEIYDLRTRRRTSWIGATVDEPGFARYQAASDSALADRLERAGFGNGENPGSRVGLTDP